MKKTIIALATLALCASLSAQNINQSVQVTNDYVGRFADFQKQGSALQVPDSLYRFDYHFDYSVFETPYKGSYEFTPYEIQVTPEARLYDGRQLYLRAGAGYTLHPQLTAALQALNREDLSVGVFAEAAGFAGMYRRFADDDPFRGHDISGRAGVAGQYLLPALRLSLKASYEGIFAGEDVEEPYFRSGFHAATLNARAQSREKADNFLFYDVDLRYRFAKDNYNPILQRGTLGENNFHLGLSGGPVLSGKYRILLDAIFEMDILREEGISAPGRFTASLGALRPHVDFLLGPVQLDAGARLDYGEWGENKKFSVSPDVTARFDMLDQNLTLFAAVSGGQSLQSHYDIKHVNHFSYRTLPGVSLSREKLRARAGVEGHWTSRLQYGLEAGYVSYAGLPLSNYCAVDLVDFQSIYAKARLAWRDERVDVDGALGYAYLTMPADVAVYAPPAFTADVRGRYNWQNRIWAGAFVEAASSREPTLASDKTIPGYVNLGLTGELHLNRRWGVWLEGGNLLGMDIERLPGYIERGPYVTAGLTLTL